MEKNTALPPVIQGEVFSAKATIKEGKTSTPKHFTPTHKGISLITVLPEAIKSAQHTAECKEQFKEIEGGTLSPQAFLADISDMTKDLVST